MANSRPYRLSFPVQLLTTGIIVAALAGAAHLTSSEEDSRAFDEAAEQTRFQLEGAARGVVPAHSADDETGAPAEREEP